MLHCSLPLLFPTEGVLGAEYLHPLRHALRFAANLRGPLGGVAGGHHLALALREADLANMLGQGLDVTTASLLRHLILLTFALYIDVCESSLIFLLEFVETQFPCQTFLYVHLQHVEAEKFHEIVRQ